MISILMATYNGEKYIAEQLNSLLNQTLLPTKIHISDDNSTDATWEIIQEYKSAHPDLIVTSQRTENSGGAKYNFMDMMIQIKDEYLMLCDQDDVWLPDKIKLTFNKMKELESKHGKKTPLLVHTDLKVVDENLNVMCESFIASSRINLPFSFQQTIMRNFATGCTCMFNRELSLHLKVRPSFFVMHDWWVALVCNCFGYIGYINTQTIYYRQHESNQVGAIDAQTFSYKWSVIRNRKTNRLNFKDSYRQAASFLNIYDTELTTENKQLLTIYAGLLNKNILEQATILQKSLFIKPGIYFKLRFFL